MSDLSVANVLSMVIAAKAINQVIDIVEGQVNKQTNKDGDYDGIIAHYDFKSQLYELKWNQTSVTRQLNAIAASCLKDAERDTESFDMFATVSCLSRLIAIKKMR
jgi:hypothetical protein